MALPPPQAVYAEPWWLEAVAPGSWGVAEVETDGIRRAVWPYVLQTLPGGLVRLGAGPLTPYLGPAVEFTDEAKRPKQISTSYSLIGELVEQLPSYDVCKLNLRVDQGPWYPLHSAGFATSARLTYVLDDLSDMSALWDGTASSTRRAIRKAEKQLSISTELNSQTLWKMVSGTYHRQGEEVPFDEALLERCVEAAVTRDRGRVFVARDDAGVPHASLFLVWDDERAYYLTGGGDPALRSSGGLSLLIWEAVKHAGSTSRTFDFEGSMVPSIEKFFANFGGRPETYFEVQDFSPRGRAAFQAYGAATSTKAMANDAKERFTNWRSSRSS